MKPFNNGYDVQEFGQCADGPFGCLLPGYLLGEYYMWTGEYDPNCIFPRRVQPLYKLN